MRPAALRLQGPDRRSVEVPVITRKALIPREIPELVAGVERPVLVVSSYLGGRARELLAKAGASYADATGNMRIVVPSPAIFLEGVGAQSNPEPVFRPLRSLRGPAARQVARALVGLKPPFGVRELAKAAEASLGTTSRVVSLLETEALLTRDDSKAIVAVDWSALLQRSAQDYELTTSNELHSFLEPRGLTALWPKLIRLPRYAATGSIAGPGIAPTRIAMLYVDDPETAASELGLVPADAGANVWLLRPFDDSVYARTRRRAVPTGGMSSDIEIVSAPQAVLDLLSSPGRGPQEAAALLEKMKEDEDAWRSRC